MLRRRRAERPAEDTIFATGSKIFATLSVSDLEAGEHVVVAIDVRLATRFGAAPTGDLEAELIGARLLSKNKDQPIPSSLQTVSLVGLVDLALPPTVTTDKYDYLPGETAYISGSGFAPEDIVELQVFTTTFKISAKAAPGSPLGAASKTRSSSTVCGSGLAAGSTVMAAK